jgi:hypothetical protein
MKLPCWRPAEQFEVANESLAHVPIYVATGCTPAGRSRYVRIAAPIDERDNDFGGSAPRGAQHGNGRRGIGRRGKGRPGSPQAHGS